MRRSTWARRHRPAMAFCVVSRMRPRGYSILSMMELQAFDAQTAAYAFVLQAVAMSMPTGQTCTHILQSMQSPRPWAL